MSKQTSATERRTRLGHLLGVIGLNDRQREELAHLHREMVEKGELPDERKYLIEVNRFPDADSFVEEATLYYRDVWAGEPMMVPLESGSEWRIAEALVRHGIGRTIEDPDFVQRLIGEEGLFDGREFTSSEVANAADAAHAVADRDTGPDSGPQVER